MISQLLPAFSVSVFRDYVHLFPIRRLHLSWTSPLRTWDWDRDRQNQKMSGQTERGPELALWQPQLREGWTRGQQRGPEQALRASLQREPGQRELPEGSRTDRPRGLLRSGRSSLSIGPPAPVQHSLSLFHFWFLEHLWNFLFYYLKSLYLSGLDEFLFTW